MQRHAAQMGADHGQFDRGLDPGEVERRGLRHRGDLLIAAGKVEQSPVGPGRTDQADAKAGGVVAKACRPGDGAHVEQVHEIGVAAQIGIQGQRFGQQLPDPVGRAGVHGVDLRSDTRWRGQSRRSLR